MIKHRRKNYPASKDSASSPSPVFTLPADWTAYEAFASRIRSVPPGTSALVRVGRNPVYTFKVAVREDRRAEVELVGIGRLRLGHVVEVPVQNETAYQRAWSLLFEGGSQ